MTINYDYATIKVNGFEIGLVRFKSNSSNYNIYYDSIAAIKRPNDKRVVFIDGENLAYQDRTLNDHLEEILAKSDKANWQSKILLF